MTVSPVDAAALIEKVEREYRDTVEKYGGDEVAERLVSKWYANVIYAEWFALVSLLAVREAELQRLRPIERTARAYRAMVVASIHDGKLDDQTILDFEAALAAIRDGPVSDCTCLRDSDADRICPTHGKPVSEPAYIPELDDPDGPVSE